MTETILSINFETASTEEQTKFIEQFLEKLGNINTQLIIEPKEGDFATIMHSYFCSTDAIECNLELSYDERRALLIANGLLEHPSETIFREDTGSIRGVDETCAQTKVYMSNDYEFMFKILDKETGLEKTPDLESIKGLVEELRGFCNDNNYHEQDETLSIMEAEYVY